MQTHVLANTTRVFTAIRQEGEKVVLHAGLWPNPDSLVPPPSKKLEWPGVLVASGAAIGDGDLVRGATLIWMTDPEDGAKSLEVMTWTLASDGSAEDEPIGALDWPESVGIDACVVRVRRSGLPALLLRSPKDGWIAIDGLGHKGPLPIPYKDTTLPIDLAFFGEQEAVLIAAEYTGLITIKRLDGTGLPSRPH